MTVEDLSKRNNQAELVLARLKDVDGHYMPSLIPMSTLSGGTTQDGLKKLLSVEKARCSGGKPRHVDFCVGGNAIVAECSRCGTGVYWDTVLKIWTT